MTDWNGLAATIATATAAGATLGVSVIAPDGSRFSHHGDRRFVAASTVKIAIMIELFRRIDEGRDSLEQVHVLRAADKTQGSGVIKELHPGLAFTVADLVYLMMAISDNSATNMLIDRVGMAAVNVTMRRMGMAQSLLGRPMRGRPKQPGEEENWAVPDEYTAMLAALFGHEAASPAACEAMIAVLEKQTNERRIARHLPRGEARPRWGTKTGSLNGVTNDVGFIMTPQGPLLLAVFVEIDDPNAGEAVIGDVARAALAALS